MRQDLEAVAKELLDLYDAKPREFRILVALYSQTLRCKPVNVHEFIEWCRNEVVYPDGPIYQVTKEKK